MDPLGLDGWWLERSFSSVLCVKGRFVLVRCGYFFGEDILDCKLWISYHHLYGNLFSSSPLSFHFLFFELSFLELSYL